MKRSRKIVALSIVAVMATASFSSPQTQKPSEEQVARILKRFPEADKDKDGKLSTEEIEVVRERFQSRQSNRRPAAAVPLTQLGESQLLNDTLASMNARFKK